MGTPATAVLAAQQVPHVVRSYEHDALGHARGLAYGMEAALALGIDSRRMFKTLVADVDGRLTVAIVPADAQLDLKALAAATGGKRARMAEPAAAERATGYVVGGISPLGQRRRLPTVLDSSAVEFATVLVSAGRRGLDVELAPTDLVRLTGARTAPLARRSRTLAAELAHPRLHHRSGRACSSADGADRRRDDRRGCGE